MLTLLLTGFEPFGGAPDNPSRRLVHALAAEGVPGVRLRTDILPVTYAGIDPALTAALERHRPDVVLSTGLAGGRPEMCIERVALNLDDARIADNDGEWRIDAAVVPGGPAAYFATLPIKAMAAAMRGAGVPTRVSQSAGTFLCNHVFYRASHLAATVRPGLRVGFVHVPWLPEQVTDQPGEPSMSLDCMLAGLRAAIEAVRRGEPGPEIAEGATS